MPRVFLVAVGLVATALAMAGAVLPGLPTTPFVLVALWAFARSSERLHGALSRIPILRHGLAEAHRFEQRRAIRPAIKGLALSMAWGSVGVTALVWGWERPAVLTAVVIAAIAATMAMVMIATDRTP